MEQKSIEFDKQPIKFALFLIETENQVDRQLQVKLVKEILLYKKEKREKKYVLNQNFQKF